MASKHLVICDREEGYASAFAHYVMKKGELSFQVQICSALSHVLKIQEEKKIDYLFISAVYPSEERKRAEADKVFVLTEDGCEGESEEEAFVYKYQSGEEILKRLIQKCSEEGEKDVFLKALKKKQGRIIGIYSPIHRIGKTSYALQLGQRMAAVENVLYLSFEAYGGVGGHFPEGGQSLSDVLYYARQEQSNLGLILTTIVGQKGKLDYVPPIQVSEDIKCVPGEEWIRMLERILDESIYEVLILDLDESIQEIYSILQICTEIHMPTVQDPIAESKVRQFEEELLLLGHENVRRKIIRKEQSLCS